MAFGSLGKIVVASAGTIKQATTTTLNVNAIMFQTLTGQSGNQMYIGTSALVKSTLVGCLHILQKPVATPASLDYWIMQAQAGGDPIDLSTIWFDADTTNDGILVSYFQL